MAEFGGFPAYGVEPSGIEGSKQPALFLNLVVLGFVAALGWMCARYEPVYWIYGALAAQVISLGFIVELWRRDSLNPV